MKVRVVKNEPAEQCLEDMVSFSDERDIMKDHANVEFSLLCWHWTSLGSPEYLDIEMTVPDRVGEFEDAQRRR